MIYPNHNNRITRISRNLFIIITKHPRYTVTKIHTQHTKKKLKMTTNIARSLLAISWKAHRLADVRDYCFSFRSTRRRLKRIYSVADAKATRRCPSVSLEMKFKNSPLVVPPGNGCPRKFSQDCKQWKIAE